MFRRFMALLLFLIFSAVFITLLMVVIPYYYNKNNYKFEYTEYVEKYSREYNIDKSFVYAVIRTESNFNPDAVSDAGAIGLMQIIEDSFDWVSTKLGESDLCFDDMFIPENSIKYGCFMLGYLYDKYGNYELTAAAYHSGMGEVDSWIADKTVNPSSPDIADFSGENTRHYVRKIMRAYEKYTELNERKD